MAYNKSSGVNYRALIVLKLRHKMIVIDVNVEAGRRLWEGFNEYFILL